MGKFIIIEGPDFCGKSTQINLLDINGYFKDHDIFFTREPGSFLPESCDKCEEIRNKILSQDNSPFDEALLFAESRFYHTQDISRILNKYDKAVVVSDRYIISSMAYQGYAQGLGESLIYKMNKLSLELLKDIPIHCVKFEISEENWLERKSKRNNLDKIEQKDIHKDVLDFYSNPEIFNEYTKDLNMIVYPINANNDIDTVFTEFKITMDNIIYGLN